MADLPTKKFKFGWFGDNGHGERVIQQILAGHKRATACLAYEEEDSDVVVGDKLDLIDKHGKSYGLLVVTKIEVRPYGSFDERMARECGHGLAEFKELCKFANGREPGADEEMRVTYFTLISLKNRIKI